MRNPIIALAALAVLATAGSSVAQDTPAPAPAPAETPPPAPTAPAGEDWSAVSRSAARVYLVDVSSLKTSGDVTSLTLARVPVTAEAPDDQSHVLVEMEFQCGAKQSRAVAEVEHDATGATTERYETGEAFSPYEAQTLDAYIAAVACDGARSVPPNFPSIKAYIDAGRP